MNSPMQHSLKFLRDRGFKCHIVEKWNSYAMVRQDAFGFGDILIFKPGWGIALVQTTTTGHLPERKEKTSKIPELEGWLASGGRVLLHGWAKRGPRGVRKTWSLTEIEIHLPGEPHRFVNALTGLDECIRCGNPEIAHQTVEPQSRMTPEERQRILGEPRKPKN